MRWRLSGTCHRAGIWFVDNIFIICLKSGQCLLKLGDFCTFYDEYFWWSWNAVFILHLCSSVFCPKLSVFRDMFCMYFFYSLNLTVVKFLLNKTLSKRFFYWIHHNLKIKTCMQNATKWQKATINSLIFIFLSNIYA